jgi:XXXCH domain-containing protein
MDLSSLKKELQETFDAILEKSSQGELPDIDQVNNFIRLSRHMVGMADDDWAVEADDFAHLAEELLLLVRQKDVQGSTMLADSLQEAQTYCHRMFRES